VEDYPAGVGSHVVGYVACEFLAFEEGAGVVGEVVEVSGHAGAFGVGNRVETHLDAINEFEEGLQQGSVEVLASYLLPHLILICEARAQPGRSLECCPYCEHSDDNKLKYHARFFFLFFLLAASFSILMISFCFLSCSEAKN
jgi:hypothetical protein